MPSLEQHGDSQDKNAAFQLRPLQASTTEDAAAPVSSDPKDNEASPVSNHGSFNSYIRIFSYASTRDRVLYGIGLICAIASGAALPLMTIVFGSSTSSIGTYAKSEDQSKINHLVLYFVYIFIGRFVLTYVGTLSVCIAAISTTNNLRKEFLGSLLRQEVAYFDLEGNGSVASQTTTNGYRINQGIAEKLFALVTGTSLFFSAYVVALVIQWKLALITMTMVPAMVIIVGGCIGVDAPIEAKIVKLHSQAAALVQDALESIDTILAYGAQEKIIAWTNKFLESANRIGQRKSLIYGILFSSQSFLVMSATALAFWEGHRMFVRGEINNVGTVFTVVLSVTLGASSIAMTMFQVQSITEASSAASELFAIIDRKSRQDPCSVEGKQPEKCSGAIEFRDVRFAYPSRPGAQVLREFTLSIPAGKKTALVGPSGCGKSTVINLLERWYDSFAGQILVDGQDIRDLNVNWWRRNVGLIQQEPTLFQGSVFDNVAKGFTTAQQEMTSEEQVKLVKQACEDANAHEFISRLPAGYDSLLGERGSTLSGGQRQRLSIARSIVSQPIILLCDEATSALDTAAESLVQDSLDRSSEGRTTIVIAHKLATIMAADNIVVMADGKVIEQGDHHTLMEQDGLYAAMVRAQDLGSVSNTATEQKTVKSTERDDCEDQIETDGDVPDTLSHLTRGTLHYPLLKCIIALIFDHPDLYRWYSLILISYLIAGGTYPAQALLFSRLITVFSTQSTVDGHSANFYALMFFVVALANLVSFFGVGLAVNAIGQALSYRYRLEIFRRFLSLDKCFFDCPSNSTGALVSKFSSIPGSLQELMSANVGLMVNVTINIVASSVMAIAFGWKLGLPLVVAALSFIVGSGYVRIRLDQKLASLTETTFSSSASLAAEAIGSVRTVSSLTLERQILRQYSDSLDCIVSTVIRTLVPMMIPYALSQSSEFLVMGLGFWYGSKLIAQGTYSSAQFFVVFLSIIFGSQSAAQFFTYTSSLTEAVGGANYLLWLRTLDTKISKTQESVLLPEKSLSVGLSDVSFHYPHRPLTEVVSGLSFTTQPGSYIGLVGASGSGKSTIVSLLERFYDATAGRVLVNDNDLSGLDLKDYRHRVSLVQQQPPLFSGSVRDNIDVGVSGISTEDELLEACRQADALDFVSSLPEGLNTLCGSRGMQFSGGQRARIALARALIRRPQLLLLDEATAALDTASERAVQGALEKAVEGRTTIAVAHRLSTVKHADVIFVLDRGRIVERGTHEELLKQEGLYAAMSLAQSIDGTT